MKLNSGLANGNKWVYKVGMGMGPEFGTFQPEPVPPIIPQETGETTPLATLPTERGSGRWFINKWFRFGSLALTMDALPTGLLWVSPLISEEAKISGTLLVSGISLTVSALIMLPLAGYLRSLTETLGFSS